MAPLAVLLLIGSLPRLQASAEGCEANGTDDPVLMQMKRGQDLDTNPYSYHSGHDYHSGNSEGKAPIPGSWRGGCKEYCTQFFKFCQAPQGPAGYYSSLQECMMECPSIPVPKGNAWGKVQNGNTMGCHAYHFGAALPANTLSGFHCNHAYIRDPMLICANARISGWHKDMRQIVWDTQYSHKQYDHYGAGDKLCKTCECSRDKKVISCGGLNLTQSDFVSLARMIPPEVEILDFSANEITTIPGGIFRKLEHLQGLDLAGNAIGKYFPRSLIGLRKLESLILDDNAPTPPNVAALKRPLPKGFLDDLVSLKEFSVINNGIEAFDADLFKHNKDLELAVLFGNPITGLPKGLLDHSPKLKLISIVGSPENVDSSVKGFPPGLFDKVPLLEQLHLTLGPTINDPAWKEVPQAVRSGMKKMPKLKGFVMWNAKYVPSLPADLFDGNPELDVVYLFNGNFTSFPEKLFAQQTKLRVVGVDGASLPDACSFFTAGNYGTVYPAEQACFGPTACESMCPMLQTLKKNNPEVLVTFGRAFPPYGQFPSPKKTP